MKKPKNEIEKNSTNAEEVEKKGKIEVKYVEVTSVDSTDDAKDADTETSVATDAKAADEAKPDTDAVDGEQKAEDVPVEPAESVETKTDKKAKSADKKMSEKPKKSLRDMGKAKTAKSVKDAKKAKPRKPAITLGEKCGQTPFWVWPATCVAAAALAGLLVWGFSDAPSSMMARAEGHIESGTTEVSEKDLDKVMATYTYEGKTMNITVRDALDYSSASSEADDDGNYTVPDASACITAAQREVLESMVDAAKVEVSDDELNAYVKDSLGFGSVADVASAYDLTEDRVKELLSLNARVAKLRSQVVGDEITAPTAPDAPAEGAEDTPTADYAKYIIDLAKDEWDADKGAWKSEDGEYASALSSYEITNDSATYEAADAAYQVAEADYQSQVQKQDDKWQAYLNARFSTMTIDLYTGTM